MKKAFTRVFEDEFLLVVNKIARIIVHPSPKKEKQTLTSIIEANLAERLYLCHRLDRDTQGLMLYAKSSQIQKDIAGQFRKREVVKKYFALTQGNFKKKKGVFKSIILDREGKKFRESPKEAETYYKVLAACRGFDLLKVTPKTGRTNQIRIHLAKARHPVLGEKKYAFRRDFVIKFSRLALCAYFLAFRHPVSQKKVEVEIGIPEYMQDFVKGGG